MKVRREPHARPTFSTGKVSAPAPAGKEFPLAPEIAAGSFGEIRAPPSAASQPTMEHAVAIIGMGVRFPGARDLAADRRMSREGGAAQEPGPADRRGQARAWRASPRHARRTPARPGRFGAGVADFAPEFSGLTPQRARIMDPQPRLLPAISRRAPGGRGINAQPVVFPMAAEDGARRRYFATAERAAAQLRTGAGAPAKERRT